MYYVRLNNVNIGYTINSSEGYSSVYQFRPPLRVTPYLDSSAANRYDILGYGSGIGTVTLNNNSIESLLFRNPSNNWPVGWSITVTCGLTAEV